MRWEEVKKTVAREVFTRIQQCCLPEIYGAICRDLIASGFEVAKGRHSLEIATAYAEKARERIMDWDVRAVGRLRDLFPWAFPPSLRTGALICYMADNANCDWMVERKA